jgi:hypothetical protein
MKLLDLTGGRTSPAWIRRAEVLASLLGPDRTLAVEPRGGDVRHPLPEVCRGPRGRAGSG